MTLKDLRAGLRAGKNIAPDKNWLKSDREFLLSEISQAPENLLSTRKNFFINLRSLVQVSLKPVYVLGAFILVLLGASLFSHQLFINAKPNDSLYIARIISERAKLNTIFNSIQRDKLAAQFANEHAQEITAVLADPNFNNEDNKDQVAKLSASFNSEIDTVKDRVNRLVKGAAVPTATVAAPASSVEGEVAIAESSVNNVGVEVFESPAAGESGSAGTGLSGLSPVAITTTNAETSATATSPEETAVSETATTTPAADTEKILDDAKKLFEQKDYSETLNKLKEVDALINQDALNQ